MLDNPNRSLALPLLLAATLGLAACETTGTSAEAPPAAAPAAQGTQLTAAEQAAWEDVIRRIAPQLNPCLEAVYAADEDRRVGEIRAIAEFEEDGTLRGMQVGNADRIEADADYRFVVEALVEGVQRCSPLRDMPAASYEYWEYFPIVYRSAEA